MATESIFHSGLSVCYTDRTRLTETGLSYQGTAPFHLSCRLSKNTTYSIFRHQKITTYSWSPFGHFFDIFLDCTGIIGLLNYYNTSNYSQIDLKSCNSGSPVPGTKEILQVTRNERKCKIFFLLYHIFKLGSDVFCILFSGFTCKLLCTKYRLIGQNIKKESYLCMTKDNIWKPHRN